MRKSPLSYDVDLFVDTCASRSRCRVFQPGEGKLLDVKVSDLVVPAPRINKRFLLVISLPTH